MADRVAGLRIVAKQNDGNGFLVCECDGVGPEGICARILATNLTESEARSMADTHNDQRQKLATQRIQ